MMRRRIAPWLWLLPAGALLIPFFLIPILMTARNSVFTDDPYGNLVPDFTFANYVRVLTDPYYLGVFANTLIAAVVVCLITLIIAYPLSWAMTRAHGRTRALLLWAIYIPIYVSVIMRVFGWMVLIADSGVINSALLGLGLITTPIRMMNEVEGMVIGLVHRYLPLMIVPLLTAMQKVNSEMLLASANLGGGRWFTWRRVVLPISLPGAIAGIQLVFAGVLSDYVIPSLMGTTRFQMLAPAIYYESSINASWALSGAMATVVLVAVAAFLLIANAILRRIAPWAGI
ncbi:ABC transporter permease [Acuticoccus kandeliae]|uniref:ABC transporter permease n=1 Tax=Acuticoccus kandeliae TaxID=2073160 RepID=UPI000D3E538B|nr:ABC transporter permease [Acuticoccus kandeliae]